MLALPVISSPSRARAPSNASKYLRPTGDWSNSTAADRKPRSTMRAASTGGSSSREPTW